MSTELNYNLSGQNILVTGSTGGLGLQSVKDFARMGAHVILAARNLSKADKVMEEIKTKYVGASLESIELDVSSIESVKRAADHLNRREIPIHVLMNNAGTLFPERIITSEGYESTFVTNFLGSFVFTNLIIPRLIQAKGSRIIFMSAEGHRVSHPGYIKDPNFDKHNYSAFAAYCGTKLSQIWFSNCLAAKFAKYNITSNALHPGGVDTPIFTLSKDKTVEEGATTGVWLAGSPDMKGVTGKYFEDEKEKLASDDAMNMTHAQALWDKCVELTGVDFSDEVVVEPL